MRTFRSHAAALLLMLPLAPLYGQTKAGTDSKSITPASAPVPISIVVFSDFECPYSAQLFFVLEKLQAKYSNQLHITYKQSPLPIHPDSPLAHKAALAAGRQGRFDAMAQLLYTNQKPQDLSTLSSFANQLHLDVARFRRDLNSSSVAAELAEDMEESRAFAVNQTPMLFLNGKSLIGYQSEETLAALIDSSTAQNAGAGAAPAVSQAEPLDPTLLAEIQATPIASKGAKDAPLTIIEFTDFQCPFCRAAVAPIEQLMATRSREVRWIVHAFPLDFHPDSELATEAALAAGEQGKFWEMHDLIFANQSAIKADNLRAFASNSPGHARVQSGSRDATICRPDCRGPGVRDQGRRRGNANVYHRRTACYRRSLASRTQPACRHTFRNGSGQVGDCGLCCRRDAANHPGPAGCRTQRRRAPYADMVCRCAQPAGSAPGRSVRDLAKQYDGKMRVMFRAFPLESHQDGRLSSAALLAALKQDRFWPMFDALANGATCWIAPSWHRSPMESALTTPDLKQTWPHPPPQSTPIWLRRPGVESRAHLSSS